MTQKVINKASESFVHHKSLREEADEASIVFIWVQLISALSEI